MCQICCRDFKTFSDLKKKTHLLLTWLIRLQNDIKWSSYWNPRWQPLYIYINIYSVTGWETQTRWSCHYKFILAEKYYYPLRLVRWLFICFTRSCTGCQSEMDLTSPVWCRLWLIFINALRGRGINLSILLH